MGSKWFPEKFPWSPKPRSANQHTYTPARQRALAQRSYGLVALAVVIVLLALSQFGEDGLATLLRLRSQEKELVNDVLVLEQENHDLEDKIDGLANDPSVLEAIAREDHNMQKKQEEVLMVLPEPFSQENQIQ